MEYDEAVEPWHELLLGKETAPGRRLVQSADGDEWVQDLWLSADVKGVLLGDSSFWVRSAPRRPGLSFLCEVESGKDGRLSLAE